MTRDEWRKRPGRSSKWIRPETRLAIYLRDGFLCGYCHRDLHGAPTGELTLDHYYPRSRGGTHHHTNLFTACARCNFARGDKPVAKMASRASRVRINQRRSWSLRRYRALAKAILSGGVPYHTPITYLAKEV